MATPRHKNIFSALGLHIICLFAYLFVSLSSRSKILSLGFTQIDLVNLSLIRIFVMSCYDLCLFSNSDTRISEKSDKANPWAVRLEQGVVFAQ